MIVSHHGAEVTTVRLQMLGSTVMRRNPQKRGKALDGTGDGSDNPFTSRPGGLVDSHWDSSLYSFLAPSC